MHLPDKQPDSLVHISTRLKELTQLLLGALKVQQINPELTSIPACSDVFAHLPDSDNPEQQSLLLICDGELNCKQSGKSVYFIESGDLVGLHRSHDLPCSNISAESPVSVKIYHYSQLQQALARDTQLIPLWSQYLIYSASFFRLALSQEIKHHYQPPTGFLHFSCGDTIIQQGSTADCVYTMLEGKARAFRDQVEVGEIIPEQIFGAMAVFTRQARTASVIADEDCTVLAVKKEDFLQLVEHQPHVCLSLIEEMAGRIHSLNQQVASRETA